VLPDKRHSPEWHRPVAFNNLRMFVVLTLLQYLLTFIDPQNDWQAKLEQLLVDFPEIPIQWMGFPEHWLDCPMWVVKNR